MRREVHQIWSPVTGADETVVVHGHCGRPVLVLPSGPGGGGDVESGGVVAAVAPLLDGGRAKLYCLASAEGSWVLDQVVPWIIEDCGGLTQVIATGFGAGAVDALSLALRRADVFPLAMCFSGRYDGPGRAAAAGGGSDDDDGGGDGDGNGDRTLEPVEAVSTLHGENLRWLREQLSVLLVATRGADEGEDPSGPLPSTRRMAETLHAKGIRCELDVWDAGAGDGWPARREQLAHHLPRFC